MVQSKEKWQRRNSCAQGFHTPPKFKGFVTFLTWHLTVDVDPCQVGIGVYYGDLDECIHTYLMLPGGGYTPFSMLLYMTFNFICDLSSQLSSFSFLKIEVRCFR